MLQVQRLNLAYGPKVILSGVSFTLSDKEKAGVIGVNGAGKSTLLKIIAGVSVSDSGQVMRPETIGYLAQDIIHEQPLAMVGTVREFLFTATGLTAAEKEYEEITNKLTDPNADFDSLIERLGEVQTQLEVLGYHEADTRAEEIIAGLQLKGVSLDRQVTSLSGGQKTKLTIASILFAHPALILLDEPTNFLDIAATKWLMGFLADYDRSVLVISHDIALLDSSLNKIIRLNELTHQLEEYKGTYSAYVKQSEELQSSLFKRQSVMKREITRLDKAERKASGFGAKGVMKMHNLARRKAELEASLPVLPARSKKMATFKFPVRRESARLVLACENLSKAYGQNKVLDDMTFTIQKGQRLVIMGPNGAGKTTLLKTLVGNLEPDEGEVFIGDKVDIGYYAQENEGLDYERTVMDEAREVLNTIDDRKIRGILGKFLFTGDKVWQQISTLSGGEKTRLALVKFVLGGYNLLFLDEPTSHLDVQSRQIIGDALAGYDGTIILVTHDTPFVHQIVTDTVLMMPQGAIKPYDKALDAYLALA